ncbi:MAG: GNAT family N-acetyltransferase [Gammaproteobacteria bacterium]|nr:GNAT family N-acetyltransferase [Gammaproteobacteria bacterium]|tara:strand:- start:91 stop:558 length:468 start_codon:yes stop_codon:yes gene_type:complete
MITIRKAAIEDLPVLFQFEQGVLTAERPMDGTLKLKNTYYYDIPNLIDDSNVELVVGEINGVTVGCGYARIKQARDCFQFDQFSYLGFMFTKEDYRGKGVNKTIMNYLYDWSLSKGIYEVRLEVYPSNKAAIKAYEKVGMQATMHTMRIDLRNRS